MLFVPHGTIKGPVFLSFFFFKARSPVFFLANFCGYWLWDLQAPVARGCIWSRAPAPGAWLSMQITGPPRVGSLSFFFFCSGLFGLSFFFLREVCYQSVYRSSWSCDRNLLCMLQGLIGVEHGDGQKKEAKVIECDS